MALDQTYVRGARPEFRKLLNGFETTLNYLDRWFKMDDYTATYQYYTFLKSVEANEVMNPFQITGTSTQRKTIDSAPSRGIGGVSRIKDTPEAVQPEWYRRRTEVSQGNVHIAVPREDAKVLGMSFPDLLRRYRDKAKHSMNRDLVRQIIRLLIRPYRENPAIDDLQPTAAEEKDLPTRYMHMFAGNSSDYTSVAGSETFRSPPRLDLFPYLTADLANYMKMGAAESISLRGDTGVPKKDKCLILMSKTGLSLIHI